jgi:hypothetical protein
VLSLLLAAIFFAGIHLGVAGTTIRDRTIAALGQGGYRVASSVATVVGPAWLVMAYNRAPYAVTWGMLEWWKPFAIILMLPAGTRPCRWKLCSESIIAVVDMVIAPPGSCRRYWLDEAPVSYRLGKPAESEYGKHQTNRNRNVAAIVELDKKERQ